MSKTRVYSVETVQLSSATVTGRVRVLAAGSAPTSGWADPELIDTPNPPRDGNVHLDFVATAPSGTVLQVITPISAERTLQASAGTVCIVVHAGSNEIKECILVEIGAPP